eukprot:08160.XXX_119915_120043_1 [CDS] Oithona nana genome sequencing.
MLWLFGIVNLRKSLCNFPDCFHAPIRFWTLESFIVATQMGSP